VPAEKAKTYHEVGATVPGGLRHKLGRFGLGWRVLAYVPVTAWAVLSLFPLYWMLVAAFSPPSVVMSTPPRLVPNPATLGNFLRIFRLASILRWLGNSLLVATVVSCSNMFLGAMAGYVLAKKRFPGAKIAFWLTILTMMIPGQLGVVPMYLLTAKLGWLDSLKPLIIPDMVVAFSIFLMKQYLTSLPTEIIESAKLDGASELRIFLQLVIPMAKPGLAVLGIYTFVGYYNALFWPLLVLSSREKFTIQPGLSTLRFQFTTDYGLWNAGAVFAMVPVFAVFFAFQRYFLRGITIGALKG